MVVVLVKPRIHWNTGNVGRTCVAAGVPLHLVGPLGFRLDSREIRRAGLDYWEKLDLTVHGSLDAFMKALPPRERLMLFSPEASRPFWEADYRGDSWLIFGSEDDGLPPPLRERFPDRLFSIPATGAVRSLNLSTAASVALYEGLRRIGLPSAFAGPGPLPRVNQAAAAALPGVTASMERAMAGTKLGRRRRGS